jgi:hypothetical protein
MNDICDNINTNQTNQNDNILNEHNENTIES